MNGDGDAEHSGDSFDVALGELDITSEHFKLAGLEDELDHLINREALDAVLSGGRSNYQVIHIHIIV